MSDAEIKRRKKIQGHISQTTGALGLAALGASSAASRWRPEGAPEDPEAAPAGASRCGQRECNPEKIKGAVNPGCRLRARDRRRGAFNFASYTNAESRKRNCPQQ